MLVHGVNEPEKTQIIAERKSAKAFVQKMILYPKDVNLFIRTKIDEMFLNQELNLAKKNCNSELQITDETNLLIAHWFTLTELLIISNTLQISS